MATIVTRAAKGSPLTSAELDQNQINLNTEVGAALAKAGGAMTGAITTNSTFDGRDVATDGTKLDGVEASADVTDTSNVTSAGALMNSQLTSIASVKALNQGLATGNSPTFVNVTATSLDISGNIDVDGVTNLDGAVDMASTLQVDGRVTAAGVTTSAALISTSNSNNLGNTVISALAIDNFTIDGTTIALTSGDFNLDVAGDIILDADGADIIFKDAGAEFGRISKGGGSDLIINASIADKDIFLTGIDGSTAITALLLDMSNAGAATFNSTVKVGGTVLATGAALVNSTSAGGFGFASNNTAFYSFGANTSTAGSYTFQNLSSNASVNVTSLSLSSTGAVFNEGGIDADFQVKSDGNANMLFVDGGANRVGIGSASSIGGVQLNVLGAAGAFNQVSVGHSANNSVSIGNHTSGDVISNLITSSSKFGGIIQGGTNGNLVVGIRDNDVSDGFFVVSGAGNQMASGYSRLRMSITPTTVVFNESGDNTDFRVESDGNANMLFVDGGANRVGIGTSSPSKPLEVVGDVGLTGLLALTGDRGTFVDSSENSTIPHIFATNDAVGDFSQEAGHLIIQPRVHTSVYRDIIFAGGTTNAKRLMTIQGEGDISFYEDTGTTPKLFWDASAESLGIGTNLPDDDLHIANTSQSGATFRLENTNISTDANTTFGTINFEGNDNSQGANGIRGSIVGKSLSANGAMGLLFSTASGGGSNTERMRIDSSGNLLVGTTTSAGSGKVTVDVGAISGTLMSFQNSQNLGGSITIFAGGGTAYNTSSDQRLKENIADADDAGSKIDAIQVRKYDWKADGSHQDYGMIAQELQAVAPEAVSGDADSEEMMGVDYSKLVPMLIKEIQSLRNRVAQLEE